MGEVYYIKDLADEINRKPNTIRGWERDLILPVDLFPYRDDNGWRYWTSYQVVLFKRWIRESKRHPGMGLANYNPSRKEIEAHIKNTRRDKE